MTLDTIQLRFPSSELQSRYRLDGYWLDRSLGTYLAGLLESRLANEVCIWSDTFPARTTMGAVHDAARRLATGLRRRGIGPGSVVTYQLPNRLETLISLYGIALAGAVVVPLVHFYGPKEVSFILRQLGGALHITSDAHIDQFDAIRSDCDGVEEVVLVGTERRGWATPFADLLDEVPCDELPAVDPMAPAVIGYTSGTTADPKGVIHTGNSFVAEALQVAAYRVGGRRPLLTSAPLAHAMGMTAGAILPLARNHPTHVLDRWVPARVLEIMDRENLSSAGGATYFLTSLFDSPGFTPHHAQIIESTGLGGAPVSPAVVERAEGLGISICRSYGSTEHPTSAGSDLTDTRFRRNLTDGRAMPGCELRLLDENGRDVTQGGVGEVWSRGPELFFGYTDPELTWASLDADGWYHTGDLAVMDEAGYITITDRKKDIIIRGGENVSAAEVEDVFMRIPGIAEVAVVAAPDPRLGEHVCAVFRVAPGAGGPTMDGVRDHFRAAGIARQKWPEELREVAEFPRTPSGKVKKNALRDQIRRSGPS